MPSVESLSLPHRQSLGHGNAAGNPRSFAIEAAPQRQRSPTTSGESFVAHGEIIDNVTNRVRLCRNRHFVVRCQMVDETVAPRLNATAPIATGEYPSPASLRHSAAFWEKFAL